MPAERPSSDGVWPGRVQVSTEIAPAQSAQSAVRGLATLPFDALRFAYAAAVQAGLARRSMLASRAVELQLNVLEKIVLGPFARMV